MEKNWGERKKYFSNVLRSLAKLVRSLAKPVEFGQTLPVYFTACSSFVCSQWSGSYHFILNLDSNKEIRQCLVQGTVLGHYKKLNVA